MLRTQVYLSEAQDKGLKKLAHSTGRSQSALIREAVDRLIEAQPVEDDWKAAFRQACGIWADHPTIEQDMRQIREDLQRRHERMERLWRES